MLQALKGFLACMHSRSRPCFAKNGASLVVVVPAKVKSKGSATRPQLEELRDYAKRRKLEIVEEYEDAAVSGVKDTRPSLDRMMKDARRRRFDAVVVWRFDRFARSVSHLLKALGEFQALGIEFI